VSFRLRLVSIAALGALVLPLGLAFAPTYGEDAAGADGTVLGDATKSDPAQNDAGQDDSAAGGSAQPDTDQSGAQPEASAEAAQVNATAADAAATPFGTAYPVEIESTFSRPYFDKGASNRDFSLLNDLERMIRGSYLTPGGKLKSAAQRRGTVVYAANSRMEDSVRVGRELVKAAKYGVKVEFIHPGAHLSPASSKLRKQLNATKTGSFRICAKGKSMACLSRVSGAIMHSKIVMVSATYTRSGKAAKGAIWTGSSNFGGRSGERTYNNGTIVYNDKLLWRQMAAMWSDMRAERNVGKDYMRYIAKRAKRYGYSGATRDGYTSNYAGRGIFYSNLANYAIYAAPVKATPSNGRDPILTMLDRIEPDDQCRIRLMENRFKYRRIAVAYKLAQLNNGGCRVSIVAFKDDWKKNWLEHCRQLLRVCKPILDVLATSRTQVDTAYAQIHDKSILVDAKLKPNPLLPEERTPDGRAWPTSGTRVKLVLSGSANLTGSNLVASDEITTITTDPDVYDAYVEHWRAVTTTKAYGIFKY